MKDANQCTLVESAKIVGDPAILLIIKSLSEGEKRYKDIKKYVSVVCDATLSSRLKKLAKQGLITRKNYDEMPPKVTYTLTAAAEPLLSVIASLEAFGDVYFKK